MYYKVMCKQYCVEEKCLEIKCIAMFYYITDAYLFAGAHKKEYEELTLYITKMDETIIEII